MKHCSPDAVRRHEWSRCKESWRVRAETDPYHIRDSDDDLALFNDMTRKDNRGLIHSYNEKDIDDASHQSSKSGNLTGFCVSPSSTPPWKGNDLLATDADKNDYDWLLTPPGTPLFPMLESKPAPEHAEPPNNLAHIYTTCTRASGLSRSNPREIQSRTPRRSPGTGTAFTPTTSSSPRSTTSCSPRSTSLLRRGRTPSPSSRTDSSPTLRPSTPTKTTGMSRSNTATTRASSSSTRSLTPVLRRMNTSPSVRSPSTEKTTTTPKGAKGQGRGAPMSPKLHAWQALELGFSNEPPPNLRTCISGRSNSRRSSSSSSSSLSSSAMTVLSASSPTTPSYSSQWRNSCSSGSRVSSTTASQDYWSSRGSVMSSSDDGTDIIEPTFLDFNATSPPQQHSTVLDTKSVENEDSSSQYRSQIVIQNNKRSTSSSESSTVLNAAVKKSSEPSVRRPDHNHISQPMFRPLLSSVPSSFYSAHHKPASSIFESSITTISNANFTKDLSIFPGYKCLDEQDSDTKDKNRSPQCTKNKIGVNEVDVFNLEYSEKPSTEADTLEQECFSDNAYHALEMENTIRGEENDLPEPEQDETVTDMTENSCEILGSKEENSFTGEVSHVGQIIDNDVKTAASEDQQLCDNKSHTLEKETAIRWEEKALHEPEHEKTVIDMTEISCKMLASKQENSFITENSPVEQIMDNESSDLDANVVALEGHQLCHNTSHAFEMETAIRWAENALHETEQEETVITMTENCSEMFASRQEKIFTVKFSSTEKIIDDELSGLDSKIVTSEDNQLCEGLIHIQEEMHMQENDFKDEVHCNGIHQSDLYNHDTVKQGLLQSSQCSNHDMVKEFSHLSTCVPDKSSFQTELIVAKVDTEVFEDGNCQYDEESIRSINVSEWVQSSNHTRSSGFIQLEKDMEDSRPLLQATLVKNHAGLQDMVIDSKTEINQEIFVMVHHSEESPRSNHGSFRLESTPQNEILEDCIGQLDIYVALEQVLQGDMNNEIRLSKEHLEVEGSKTFASKPVYLEALLVPKAESSEETEPVASMNPASDYQCETTDFLTHTKPIMSNAEQHELTDPLSDVHLDPDNIEPNKIIDIEEIHGSSHNADPAQVATTFLIMEADLSLDASESVESTNSVKDNYLSTYSADEPTTVHPYPTCAETTETSTSSSMDANLSDPHPVDISPEESNHFVEADDPINKSMDVPMDTTSIPEESHQHRHTNESTVSISTNPEIFLGETTNKIVFCSSIVHEIMYKAANIAAEKERTTLAIAAPKSNEERRQLINSDYIRSLRGTISRSVTLKKKQKEAESAPKVSCNDESANRDEPITQHPVPMDGMSKVCDSSNGGADEKKPSEVNNQLRLGTNSNCHCVVM